MRVSVLIPALDEEAELSGALASALSQAPRPEVLVADGGSRDATPRLVTPPARLVRSPPGRARQLNAALSEATGDVVVVLHADCRLPPAALALACAALGDPAVVGGAFLKRFASDARLLRGAARRTRLWHGLGLVFGDQAMFVRRSALEAAGGFREDVVAEDLALARALRRQGELKLLPAEVLVSPRRLEARGVLRTWATWWLLVGAHLAHVPPRLVRRLYPDIRAPAGARDVPQA